MVTRPVNEGLEGLVKHRGAPTCVETHVKTSIESVKAIYRLPLTAWTHAEQAHRDRSSALCASSRDGTNLKRIISNQGNPVSLI